MGEYYNSYQNTNLLVLYIINIQNPYILEAIHNYISSNYLDMVLSKNISMLKKTLHSDSILGFTGGVIATLPKDTSQKIFKIEEVSLSRFYKIIEEYKEKQNEAKLPF